MLLSNLSRQSQMRGTEGESSSAQPGAERVNACRFIETGLMPCETLLGDENRLKVRRDFFFSPFPWRRHFYYYYYF